jgi:integrase/recombinase XerD
MPLNMLSKWTGHATPEVTAICADALGAEERDIAARMWS